MSFPIEFSGAARSPILSRRQLGASNGGKQAVERRGLTLDRIAGLVPRLISADAVALKEDLAEIKSILLQEPQCERIWANLQVELEGPEFEGNSVLVRWKAGDGWKDSFPPVHRFIPRSDQQRRSVLRAVSSLVELLSSAREMPVSDWVDFGTKGESSDIDVNVLPVQASDSNYLIANAQVGRKAALATIFWEVLCEGSVHFQADAGFYPQHPASVLDEEIRRIEDPEAKAISAWALEVGRFYSLVKFLPGKDLNDFLLLLSNRLETTTERQLRDLLVEIRSARGRLQSDREESAVYSAGMVYLASAQMEELGKEILAIDQRLVRKGGERSQDQQRLRQLRERKLARYVVYSVLRSMFLPEGYVSHGAYRSVCVGRFGQQFARGNEARSSSFGPGSVWAWMLAFSRTGATEFDKVEGDSVTKFRQVAEQTFADDLEDELFREDLQRSIVDFCERIRNSDNNSQPSVESLQMEFLRELRLALSKRVEFKAVELRDLIDSAVENFAYACSMKDLVHASKYFYRFSSAVSDSLGLLEQEGSLSSEAAVLIPEIRSELNREGAFHRTILASKRGRWDLNSFVEELRTRAIPGVDVSELRRVASKHFMAAQAHLPTFEPMDPLLRRSAFCTELLKEGLFTKYERGDAGEIRIEGIDDLVQNVFTVTTERRKLSAPALASATRQRRYSNDLMRRRSSSGASASDFSLVREEAFAETKQQALQILVRLLALYAGAGGFEQLVEYGSLANKPKIADLLRGL